MGTDIHLLMTSALVRGAGIRRLVYYAQEKEKARNPRTVWTPDMPKNEYLHVMRMSSIIQSMRLSLREKDK